MPTTVLKEQKEYIHVKVTSRRYFKKVTLDSDRMLKLNLTLT